MTKGERIKELRLQSNLTQEEVAKKLGTSKQTIYKYENNIITNIPSDKVEELATLFRTTPENIMGWTSNDDPDLSGVTNLSRPNIRALPILGCICAGDGVDCQERYEGTFFVDASIKGDYCLNVRGESMADVNIHDGDRAVLSKCYEFIDGRIYGVRIEWENLAVLKRVHEQGDKLMLSPCNADPQYQPLLVDKGDVSIVGECTCVYHVITYK